MLHDQLDYKRKFYETDEAGVLDRTYPYLNEKTMTRFVDDCTSTLSAVYAALRGGADFRNGATALDFVDKAQVTPYASPLGDEAA